MLMDVNTELQYLASEYIEEQVDILYNEMLDEMFGQYPQWNDDFVFWESLA